MACALLSTVFALLARLENMVFVWTAAAVGISTLVAALTTHLNAQRDTVLFAVSGLAGGVFFGASEFGFPHNLPLWIWLICCFGAATVALITDADAAQNKPVHRL